MRYLVLILLVLSFCRPTSAEYTAVDGDSLVRGDERIRLKGIDAPELSQKCRDEYENWYDCGRDSFEFLQSLMKDREIRCKCQKKRDRYKRKLCECFADGSSVSLNYDMVASGFAVSYKSKFYKAAEEEAEKHKYGIWRGRFMRPAVYRALQRANEKNGK